MLATWLTALMIGAKVHTVLDATAVCHTLRSDLSTLRTINAAFYVRKSEQASVRTVMGLTLAHALIVVGIPCLVRRQIAPYKQLRCLEGQIAVAICASECLAVLVYERAAERNIDVIDGHLAARVHVLLDVVGEPLHLGFCSILIERRIQCDRDGEGLSLIVGIYRPLRDLAFPSALSDALLDKLLCDLLARQWLSALPSVRVE